MQALRVRLIQDPFNDIEFGKNPASPSSQFVATSDRRFEFQKRRQLFVRGHNVTLPVAAMCVNSPDRSLAVPFLLRNRSLPTLFWNTSSLRSRRRGERKLSRRRSPRRRQTRFTLQRQRGELRLGKPASAQRMGKFGAASDHRAIGKVANRREAALRWWQTRRRSRGQRHLGRLWLVAAGLAVGP